MKVAVVGGGVAGLSVLWHLLQDASVSATLFDPHKPGSRSSSSVSTGLLHPFPGRQALRSWRAQEGMEATLGLIGVAENALGRPVADRSGILRLCLTETQQRDFRKRSEIDPGGIWWSVDQVLERVPKAAPAPGLWIPEGVKVYSALYLEGLWLACEQKGAAWESQKISSLDQLSDFDAVVLATGAETLQFKECKHLPLKATKGQALLCRWPESLPFSIISGEHITPALASSLCQIGSTYERSFATAEPDPARALPLLDKAALFYPPARDFEVVEIQAGVRMSPLEGYRPIVEKIAPKAWVFTGLGSRGLLYHALLGKELVSSIFNRAVS